MKNAPHGVGWLMRVLVVLALFGPQTAQAATHPRSAPVATTADGANNINRLATLVHNEFKDDVPWSRLSNGALKGMRDFLKKNNYNANVVPEAVTASARDFSEVKRAYATTVKKYPGVNPKQLSYAAIRGMLEVLEDPYTVFMDPDEYRNLMSQLNGGNFGGLGIYIEIDDKNDKALTVVEPMEGTPATEAGLKPRDVIVEIDGKPTRNMALEEATKLLRGPVGSTVVLTIKRSGADAVKVPVVRAIIRVRTVSYKVVSGNVGYIKLRVFGDAADEEMEEAFRAFDKNNVKAYILDLRNNGGGYITAALDVASKFLPTGSRVVSVAERGSPEIVYNSRPNLRTQMPVVVLINKYSASASEITAGALKDLKSGVLIGEKSFGKGSVQKIFPLPDGSALKVTTAHYHTPSGVDIHKKGILPDVAVTMKLEELGTEHDTQLQAAVSLLEQKIAQAAKGTADAGQPLRAGAIRVSSTSEEFDYVSRMHCADGGSYHIESQSVVNDSGRYYDQVTVKCDKSGESKTLYFQIDLLGK